MIGGFNREVHKSNGDLFRCGYAGSRLHIEATNPEQHASVNLKSALTSLALLFFLLPIFLFLFNGALGCKVRRHLPNLFDITSPNAMVNFREPVT